jgi:hypothetical protein
VRPIKTKWFGLYIGKDVCRDRDAIVSAGFILRPDRKPYEISWKYLIEISWNWLPPRVWHQRTTANGFLGPNEYYAGRWTGLPPIYSTWRLSGWVEYYILWPRKN